MNPNQPRWIIILANEMDDRNVLNEESRSRADVAAEVANRASDATVITCGWAYRPDSDSCIADVLAQYLIDRHHIDRRRIICQRQSRDTVGDAIYARQLIENPDLGGIVVATSDYHVPRTERIFKMVFGERPSILVIGAASSQADEERSESEAKSLEAFESTFFGIEPGDIDSFFQRMAERHPYYNGILFPEI